MTSSNACLGLLLAAVAGCSSLVDPNVADFDLTLPEKSFSIDAAGWQIDEQQAQTYLGEDCSLAPTYCSAAAEAVCEASCTGTCNASKRCELKLDVSLYQAVNLVDEKPELKTINDQPVIKVTLDSVTYEVVSNTLNVSTPVLKVYVAPATVMDPKSAEAIEIGTVPAIEASGTTEPTSIMFTPMGRAKLVEMMSTYKTPFNVIVGSSLTVTAGQPIPRGKLDAVIRIKAHAGL